MRLQNVTTVLYRTFSCQVIRFLKHSLATLERIAAALDRRVEVRFVPVLPSEPRTA